MRTTIEISDDLRARLLEIAARRGLKGYSSVIEEALRAFLRAEEDRASAARRALRLRGTLSEEDAEGLRERVRALRHHWR